MEQENLEKPNITRFDELVKNLEQHVMEMDGLQCFAAYFKNGKKESLSLVNPANRYGSVNIPASEALHYIGDELDRKMKEAQEIAEQLKDMLCFGGFENWNKADSQTQHKEHPTRRPDAMKVFVRDELEQVVNGWCRRFDASEEDVWDAVHYWGEEWGRLLEGKEKARQMKVGDRVRVVNDDNAGREIAPGCYAPSHVGRTGIVTDIGFSRSHGDVANVDMGVNGTWLLNVKDLEVIKEE